MPAVFGIVWLYQRLSAPAVTRSRALRSDINAQAAESIAGMAVVQASGATAAFAERFAATNAAHYAARRQELRANAWLLRPALDLLNVMLLAAVIGVFSWRSAQALGGLLGHRGGRAVRLRQLHRARGRAADPDHHAVLAAAAGHGGGGAREHPARRGRGAEVRLAGAGEPGAISVRGLDFAYLPGRPVLHGLNLEIAAGSFVGIVGHTGSGKSTLLSLLLRFYAGAARHAAHRRPADRAARRRRLPARRGAGAAGALPAGRQRAREHRHGPRPERRRDRGRRARPRTPTASSAGWSSGYDTPLGEGGARLSVGEKQLIAIARALAGQPRILLLDEATSHIDSETEAVVQQALAGLRGRVTVVAIAHRLSTIRDADEIVVLNHGRIAERGTHGALMAIEGGLYQRLVQLQQLAALDEPG